MLQGLWERVLGEKLTPEVRARVVGVQAQMEKFQFYFGVALGELIFRHADSLSKTLQSSKISAAEGQRVAELTVETLERL